MRGDKLVIREEHRKAAWQLMELLFPQIASQEGRFIITIGGESGSGKSEVASVLSDLIAEKGMRVVILQQDDYFQYPPKTNAEMRKKDIGHVGLSEVRLALFDQNLKDIIDGKGDIQKPLVFFEEDRIDKETIDSEGIQVVIAEGTYTTSLKNVHRRVFIDRTYVDTREARKYRAREEQDDFLEKILEIEHEIISSHKAQADIIVTKNYDVEKNDETKK